MLTTVRTAKATVIAGGAEVTEAVILTGPSSSSSGALQVIEGVRGCLLAFADGYQ